MSSPQVTPDQAAEPCLLQDGEHPVAMRLCMLAQERQATHPSQGPDYSCNEGADGRLRVDPLEFFQGETHLPSCPAALAELQELMAGDGASTARVADVIARDPGLAAWVLRLVNSAWYGLPSKVESIPRAVAMVGMRQIQALASGGALMGIMGRVREDIFDAPRFWRHSLGVALAAQSLWQWLGKPERERLFTAGLLHDVGWLVMVTTQNQPLLQALVAHARDPLSSAQREQQTFGFDHARIGSMLLHKWAMPMPLVLTLLRHHAPMGGPVGTPPHPEPIVVHLADAIAYATGNGRNGCASVPALSVEALDHMGLTAAAVDVAVAELDARLDALCEAMLPTS